MSLLRWSKGAGRTRGIAHRKMKLLPENNDNEPPTEPDISIIIPVLHESARINALVEGIRSMSNDRIAIEIIVVDGSPDADTLAALIDPDVVRVRSRKGRAAQMNIGATVARGKVMLFLHADTRLPKNAFQDILSALEDKHIVGGAFDLGIDSDLALFRITEQYVRLRTRFSRVPFGDQAIFLRSEYFKTMQGYQDIPIMEDVELMKRVRRNNDRIKIIPRRVMTSARRWEREGVVRALFRNWSLQILYMFGVRADRLAKYYRDEVV